MREIIFMGKRIDNGEWVYGSLFAGFKKCYICPEAIAMYNFDGALCLGGFIEVDPSTVGQYTGRQCKNGKVFDGDIGKNIDGVFLVCWDEEKAAFVMRFLEYPFETLYLEEMYDDTEIIGNIHDNPELLGGKFYDNQ